MSKRAQELSRLTGERVYTAAEAAPFAGFTSAAAMKTGRSEAKEGGADRTPAWYDGGGSVGYLYVQSDIDDFKNRRKDRRRGKQGWPQPPSKTLSAGEFGAALYRWQLEELRTRQTCATGDGLDDWFESTYYPSLERDCDVSPQMLAIAALGGGVFPPEDPSYTLLEEQVRETWRRILHQEKHFRYGWDLKRDPSEIVAAWPQDHR